MVVGMIRVSGCCQGGGSSRQSGEAAGAFIQPWQGHEVVGLPGDHHDIRRHIQARIGGCVSAQVLGGLGGEVGGGVYLQ